MSTGLSENTGAGRVDFARLASLKRFDCADRSRWGTVPEAEWQDWRWQYRNRIRSEEQLVRLGFSLSENERAGFRLATGRLRFEVTPYFSCLMDRVNPHCPIRRQLVPTAAEMRSEPGEMLDPCGEDAASPVPGLVHRYPDRVLLLAGLQCAGYCRYCTRARMVGRAGYVFDHGTFAAQLEYLRAHRRVRDVLISGGDPLLLGDERLELVLRSVRQIPHVEIVRLGTRVPVFLPQRITPGLCAMLRQYHPLFVSVHVNHPLELTAEARDALALLADAGIPLASQSVLLRGINDDETTLLALMQKLLLCRVRPYYLYQCDPVVGTAHMRVGLARGLELIECLRGLTSGLAVPSYVLDAPVGGGKLPLAPGRVTIQEGGRILVRTFTGCEVEYPESDLVRDHNRQCS